MGHHQTKRIYRPVTMALILMCLGTLRAGDATSVQYGRPRQLCTLKTKKITESSGLAVSRRDPNLLWTHNDSGDDAHIYCTEATWSQVACSPSLGSEKATSM